MAGISSMIVEPTRADFEPRIGDVFAAAHEGAAIELQLREVRPLGTALRPGGAFSLTFAGPNSPLLPQATYRIENAALGALDIFIVPVDAAATAWSTRRFSPDGVVAGLFGIEGEQQVDAFVLDQAKPQAAIERQRKVHALDMDAERAAER